MIIVIVNCYSEKTMHEGRVSADAGEQRNRFIRRQCELLFVFFFIFCIQLHMSLSYCFSEQILQDSNAVRQQLSDLQTRHEEFLKIEKSIVQVRDMFTEMAFLVEKQVRWNSATDKLMSWIED